MREFYELLYLLPNSSFVTADLTLKAWYYNKYGICNYADKVNDITKLRPFSLFGIFKGLDYDLINPLNTLLDEWLEVVVASEIDISPEQLFSYPISFKRKLIERIQINAKNKESIFNVLSDMKDGIASQSRLIEQQILMNLQKRKKR